MTNEETTDPLLAAAYVTAAVVWLGMALRGLLGDCGPLDHDGQCGMSTFFGAAFGGVIAFLLIAVGIGLTLSDSRTHRSHVSVVPSRDSVSVREVLPQGTSRGGLRLIGSGGLAFGAGIVTLCVSVAARLSLVHSQSAGAGVLQGLELWPIIAFVSAPYVYAIVCVVAVASSRRARRSGAVSAFWACGVAGASGLLLGLLVAFHVAPSVSDGTWLASSVGCSGVVVGWVFWRAGQWGHVNLGAGADTGAPRAAI
jgi:hypothetical protein